MATYVGSMRLLSSDAVWKTSIIGGVASGLAYGVFVSLFEELRAYLRRRFGASNAAAAARDLVVRNELVVQNGMRVEGGLVVPGGLVIHGGLTIHGGLVVNGEVHGLGEAAAQAPAIEPLI